MEQIPRIQVALDKALIGNLLNGLYSGARGKNLKVVIDVNGVFHIDSKELRIAIAFEGKTNGVQHIQVHNDKQSAEITAAELESLGMARLASDVARELREKYSPAHHSLADNIYVFSRTYNG